MDSSPENTNTAQPPRGAPPTPSQPVSPSLQRAAQVHYVDPTGSSAPFEPPPPPLGGGDDAPTLRARPAPRWPGQACRYCGWRPVEPGSTCPQCHQPVPAALERAVPWRPIAIGATGFTVALAMLLIFTLLHHPQATVFSAKAPKTLSTRDAPTATVIGSATGTPTSVATNSTAGPAPTVGVGGAPGTATAVAATPTHTTGTPLPTNTSVPSCPWQSRTSSGTYYIYWPGDATYGLGHYGYVISATIHYNGCGAAYAGADVTSNDDGSPPSIVTAVLYRTANCNGSDAVLSQQHDVMLVAGAHSVGTISSSSYGQHCVYAVAKVALGADGSGNSQTVTSVIANAE